MHVALRELALPDPDLACDAFGVVMNCAGAWRTTTEEHGEDALTFEHRIAKVGAGGLPGIPVRVR